eukprot:179892_1
MSDEYLQEALGNATIAGLGGFGACYNAMRLFYAPFPKEQNIANAPVPMECGWTYVSKTRHLLKLISTRIVDIVGDLALILFFIGSFQSNNNLLSLAVMIRIVFWRMFTIMVDWRVYGVLQYEWKVMLEASIIFSNLCSAEYEYDETYRFWVIVVMGFCEVFTIGAYIPLMVGFVMMEWVCCPIKRSCSGGPKKAAITPDYLIEMGDGQKPMRYIAQWVVGMTKFGSLRFKLFILVHYIYNIQEGFGFATPFSKVEEPSSTAMIKYMAKIVINGILFLITIVLYRKEFIRFLKVSVKQMTCRCCCCCLDHKEGEVWNDILMYQEIYTGHLSPITIITLSGQKRVLSAEPSSFGGFTVSVQDYDTVKSEQTAPGGVVVSGQPSTDKEANMAQQIGANAAVQNHDNMDGSNEQDTQK